MISSSEYDSPELRQLQTVRVLIRDDTKDWAPAVRGGVLIALDKIESALHELIERRCREQNI